MENNTAFVVGYTGAVGKALVNALILDNYFKTIILIGRRKVELPTGADDRFIQEIVDFDRIGDYSRVFKDCKVGFCCLGCSDVFANKETFVRIDKDYVINTASVAKDAGCEHFHVISSQNADSSSKFTFYRRLKGQTEDGLKRLNFTKLNIYRPGFLIAKRENSSCTFKTVEVFFKCLCYPCLFCCCKNTMSIKVENIATAMVYKARNPPLDHTEILENFDIIQMAQ